MELEIQKYDDSFVLTYRQQEEPTSQLQSIFNENRNTSSDDAETYMSFRDSVHVDITSTYIYNTSNHPLYNDLHNFDTEGIRVLNKIENISTKYLESIDTIRDDLKDVFEALYEEEYPE